MEIVIFTIKTQTVNGRIACLYTKKNIKSTNIVRQMENSGFLEIYKQIQKYTIQR